MSRPRFRNQQKPSHGVVLICCLALLLIIAVLSGSCTDQQAAKPQAQDQGTGTSSPPRVAGEEVVVPDPYHSDVADAPNYLLPEGVSVAPLIRLAPPPLSVPAERIVMDDRPQTDLTLRTSPADPTELFWSSPVEDPMEVSLGGQEVAIEHAKSFLQQHGLWQEEWGEPTVTVGSSVSGSSANYQVTSWLVLFAGRAVLPDIGRSVSVRIGHENKAVDLSLRLPKLEPLAGKVVRLRSLEEVLDNLEAWKNGRPGWELQEKAHGAVKLTVNSYQLLYERPLAAEGDYLAVPVYEFDIEIGEGEFSGLKGTWRVVAAADTESPATRGGDTLSELNGKTYLPVFFSVPGVVSHVQFRSVLGDPNDTEWYTFQAVSQGHLFLVTVGPSAFLEYPEGGGPDPAHVVDITSHWPTPDGGTACVSVYSADAPAAALQGFAAELARELVIKG